MLKRLLFNVVLVAIWLGTILLSIHTASGASTFEARTNDAGGVRVVVTPKVLTPGAQTWDFEVVMDTHTKPLTEDLVRGAVLVVGPE